MDAEISMLMQSMFMLINLLIAIFLEKATKKNNKNSSKPSSEIEKDESSTTHMGTNGKGKQESDAIANNTRTIETVTVAHVTQCNVRGQDLIDAACEHVERRTKIDIVFETVVEHIDGLCRNFLFCLKNSRAEFSLDATMPLTHKIAQMQKHFQN